ncbi:DUF2259 domain-containing protein [Coralliovum pocilloporae]|uniref:DUF2259 domain-containing protein n=1 Tax=Coralliovum pocilloporae TaxID=3066369 RepID=UPI003307C517
MRYLTGLFVLILGLVFGWAGPVLAGDSARLHVIGFSAGGQLFAFEEYGVQDGSGFPYSSIYVVDLAGDDWLPGTPIRVLLDDEAAQGDEVASVLSARQQALSEAASLLDDRNFTNPGHRLASQPIGEVDGDPYTLAFGLANYNPLDPPLRRFDLRMTVYDQPASSSCANVTGPSEKALALEIMDLETDAIRKLYQDSKVPKSRNCPLDYRLSEIWVPERLPDPDQAVVLVSVFSYGFEGPDQRFIAIPFKLP